MFGLEKSITTVSSLELSAWFINGTPRRWSSSLFCISLIKRSRFIAKLINPAPAIVGGSHRFNDTISVIRDIDFSNPIPLNNNYTLNSTIDN